MVYNQISKPIIKLYMKTWNIAIFLLNPLFLFPKKKKERKKRK